MRNTTVTSCPSSWNLAVTLHQEEQAAAAAAAVVVGVVLSTTPPRRILAAATFNFLEKQGHDAPRPENANPMLNRLRTIISAPN
jgi:hypothetical protein